jgi:hypothetical protein
MIRNYLQSIEGVEIYPLISLVVFVVFFVAVFIWILKIDNNYIKKMKELPLELDNDRNLNSTGEKNDE